MRRSRQSRSCRPVTHAREKQCRLPGNTRFRLTERSFPFHREGIFAPESNVSGPSGDKMYDPLLLNTEKNRYASLSLLLPGEGDLFQPSGQKSRKNFSHRQDISLFFGKLFGALARINIEKTQNFMLSAQSRARQTGLKSRARPPAYVYPSLKRGLCP